MEQYTHPLWESFEEFFSLSVTSNAAQSRDAYRIRYRVYCEDMQFEPADRYPNGLEQDEFDPYSQHCLVIHKRTGKPAGCMRVVQASEEQRLPFEKFCRASMYTQFAREASERRDSICEFSRMAVDRDFRRRSGETFTGIGEINALDTSHKERRSFSLIGVATNIAAFALADLNGRDRVFAMMEPHLPRLLRRSGFLMEQAGEPTEYHGQRALYFSRVEQLVENLRPELREFYDAVHKNFSGSLARRVNVA